jgi:hypothetical protein
LDRAERAKCFALCSLRCEMRAQRKPFICIE